MRIAVAMSGGVDSSTAAALLVEQGHDVVGFTLKVWESSRCCSLEDVEDARRVARHLDIPFYVLDAHAPFEAEVVRPFVRAYERGLTPNPCIRCNQRIKFRWLAERARVLGCELLATGHYARVEGDPGARRLRKGVDPVKDQTYFLVPEDPADLDRVIFPLGGRTKAEAREIAARNGLPVAEKRESQDLCFVPDGSLARFLEDRLGRGPPGKVVDREGRVLGTHRGVYGYTVGQRRGLGIAAGKPLYVLRRVPATNQIVVGPREGAVARCLVARDPTWMNGRSPAPEFECTVKIRSTGRETACKASLEGPRVRVRFAQPQFAVAPGQMAVLYDGDTVVGGAWIESAEDVGRDAKDPAPPS